MILVGPLQLRIFWFCEIQEQFPSVYKATAGANVSRLICMEYQCSVRGNASSLDSEIQQKPYAKTMAHLLPHPLDISWSFQGSVIENSVFYLCSSHNLLRDINSVSSVENPSFPNIHAGYKSYLHSVHQYIPWIIFTLIYITEIIFSCRKTLFSRFILILNKDTLKERKWHFQDEYDWGILNFYSLLKFMHWTAIQQPVNKHKKRKDFFCCLWAIV